MVADKLNSVREKTRRDEPGVIDYVIRGALIDTSDDGL